MNKMDNQKKKLSEYVPEMTWIEQGDGSFVPTKNYNSSLTLEDGKTLNDIDWKKVQIAKKGLMK
jgi:hypothetical protein